MQKVSGLPFVAAGILSPGITCGLSRAPLSLPSARAFHLGCSSSPIKSLSEGGFLRINSELPWRASWCQGSVRMG